MAKSVHNDVLDAALNHIKTNATQVVLCSGEPASFAGIAAVALADVAVDSSDWTGPADGDTSGRKLTMNAQTGVTVDSGGTGTHLAVATASVLLYVTTTSSTAVAGGGTVDIGTWKIEIADPA
jgi:hypothetical protein